MIGFHGTNRIDEVLKNGLNPDMKLYDGCKHICLSDRPEIAANFGNVVVVNLDGIETDGWFGGETRTHESIPPARIRRFTFPVVPSWEGFFDPGILPPFRNRFVCFWRMTWLRAETTIS